MKSINNLVGDIPHVEFDFIDDWNNRKVEPTDGIDCPICLNKGYIRKKRDENGENDLINSYLVECSCMKKRKAISNAKKSGLGELLEHRVVNYKPYNKKTLEARNLAIKYIKEKSSDWFVLLGQSGSGKTMLCSAICNELLNQGKEVVYQSWNALSSEYKHQLRNGSNELIEKLQTVEILYLDDLFKGSQSDFDVKNIAYDIINYRYNNRLTTIISSEYTLNELIDIDSAITGRIKQRSNGYLLEMIGKENNYRMR